MSPIDLRQFCSRREGLAKLGGGFGGLEAAKALASEVREDDLTGVKALEEL